MNVVLLRRPGSETSEYSRCPATVTSAVVDVGAGVGGRDRLAVEQHPDRCAGLLPAEVITR